jgi:NADPH:quinone reductase-like Zn-dependent oxidoreductase
MKAIVLDASGGTENFSMREIPEPTLKPNEVLVEVHSIAVNPVDIKTRKGGSLYASLKEQAPVILGWDISGIVRSIGNEVTRFQEGDEVFGMVNFPGHGKAYAQYVAAPEVHLALKPGNISHREAAASSLAALTAWQVLVHEVKIKPGQHLLMHAAAGGVGHFAVQMARHFGAVVTGTASASNAGFLKEIGVNDVIDYTRESFEDKVREVDVVFDPIGGDTTVKSLKVLKRGGNLVSIVGGVKENYGSILEETGVSAKNYLVHSSGSDLEQLAQLLEQGSVKVHIYEQYSFDQMAEAHRQIETGKTRGKVVVNVV